jgi:hypothetical protein
LHPKPRAYETLEQYVRRLTEGYGARYESCCLHALGIPCRDRQARWFREPAPDVLQRLADGTGVPVAHLEQMTSAQVWARRLDELRQFAATPEGEAELARPLGRGLSQNS